MTTDYSVFVLGSAAAVLTGYVCALWRAVEERQFRSRMYALRDELRWAAIQNPKVAESRVFDVLDDELSCSAHEARVLSPYIVFPFLVSREMRQSAGQRAASRATAIRSSGLPIFDDVAARIAIETYRYFWRRSPFATAAVNAALRLVSKNGHHDPRYIVGDCSRDALQVRRQERNWLTDLAA